MSPLLEESPPINNPRSASEASHPCCFIVQSHVMNIFVLCNSCHHIINSKRIKSTVHTLTANCIQQLRSIIYQTSYVARAYRPT